MIIMEWIKKITDIIMPEPADEEDEVKETKKAEAKDTKETKASEPLREAAAEKKSEQAEPQVQAQAQAQSVRQEHPMKQALGGNRMFTRTGGTVTTSDGETQMNGIRLSAYTTEASVKPSLAVVKTAQITLKIYTPQKYDEQVQSIGQDLIKRTAVIVNYEGLDDGIQQRIGDFVLGVVYTINGRVEMITNKIVLYAPEGLEVTSAQAALANMARRYN